VAASGRLLSVIKKMKSYFLRLKKILDQFPFLKQFIKFCFVGGTAAIINFSVLTFLVELLGVWYVFANLCGGFISAIFNFFSNKFWTFRNQELGKKAFKQGFKFIFVMVSSVILNTLFIFLITEFIGFDYRLSWVIATGLITFWNFTLNRFWTFAPKVIESEPLNKPLNLDYN